MRPILVVFCSLIAAGCLSSQTLDNILRDDGALDEATVAEGLREALRVGTERSVASTSQLDGFFGNALIRITVPQEYATIAGTLEDFGLGDYVDDFERSMNRAAERASGEAVDVFWDAIRMMTIADAFAILNGGGTAATDYFRRTTSSTLNARFQPIVQQKMQEVGVYNMYEDLVAQYNRLPVDKPAAVDIDQYVTDRAVGGIFLILEGEERRIREDPAARTTAILRRVFGHEAEAR